MTENTHCANPKCGKELIHVEGRRKKKYCSTACKTVHWQALNPVRKPQKVKIIPMEEWKEIKEQLNKVSLIPLMDIEEVKKMVDAYGNRSKDDIERELGQSDFKPQEPSKTEKQASVSKKEKEAPVAPENSVHKLWKEGDPKENSAAFFMKYGVENYTELQKQLK